MVQTDAELSEADTDLDEASADKIHKASILAVNLSANKYYYYYWTSGRSAPAITQSR
jgi:hypothetical protein